MRAIFKIASSVIGVALVVTSAPRSDAEEVTVKSLSQLAKQLAQLPADGDPSTLALPAYASVSRVSPERFAMSFATPVDARALARFLPAWQGVATRPARGADGLLRVIEQLAGVPLPASALESLVLPSRVADYSPAFLDELTLAGEVTWTGAGRLPNADGWVCLAPSDLAPSD